MKGSELVGLPAGQLVQLRPKDAARDPGAVDEIIVARIATDDRYRIIPHADRRWITVRSVELDDLTADVFAFKQSDGQARLVVVERVLSRHVPHRDGWWKPRKLQVVAGRDVLQVWDDQVEADVLAERDARFAQRAAQEAEIVARREKARDEREAVVARVRSVLHAAGVSVPTWKLDSSSAVFTVAEMAKVIDHLTTEGQPR